MNILVIGATGFIGARVVRRLVAEGHRVAVFHRGRTDGGLPEGVAAFHGDRADLGTFRSRFERFGPEVVLDVVPYTEHEAAALVRVFTGLARRLVALSSADVYRQYDGLRGKRTGPPDTVPLDEDAPLRASRYPYRGYEGTAFEQAEAYEKILVEETVGRSPSLPGTVLRLPAVYGPGDGQRRFYPWLRRMDDARPFILLGEGEAAWRWTHGYVDDVAAAIALAVADERAAGRTYNVGEAEAPTQAERVRRLGEAAGWTGAVRVVPEERLPAALRTGLDWAYPLVTDTRRIRAELGYREPVSPHEALLQTIAWERAHPPPGRQPFDYAAEDACLTST